MSKQPIYKHAGIIVKVKKEKEVHILFAKIIILHCLFHRQGLCTEAKSSNRRGTFPIVSPTLENLGGT